jgi:4-amino-4-deoxy-L-arabinose transferase-like glycosyltransferase
MAASAFDFRVYRALAVGFLALKLVLLVAARPFMDETYYWLWGQHLSLSYFDHPPLVGWTQALASFLGWNTIGLRAFVLLTLIGDLALLYGFARHIAGAAWRDMFWASAALFLATPIFFGLTNLALPDHLLVFFALAAIYAFTRFRTAYEAGVPRWHFLYLAAIAVGLATLSKYSGALLAACIFLIVVFTPKLRSLFRSPHLYIAMALTIVMQAPVLIWNLQNDMASFGFIFGGRRITGDFDWGGVAGFVLGFPLVLSPFLLWPLGRFLFARDDSGNNFVRLIFWFSTLGFFAASFFTDILIHWNAIAYAAVLPFLAEWLRSKWLAIGHFAFGGLIALLLAVNYTVMPLVSTFTYTDQSTSLSYGWDEVVPEVEKALAERDIGFIATPWYASAGALAFALRDRDVTSLFPGRDAFDYWFDPAAHAGQNALIVADRKRGLTEAIQSQFKSVRRIKRLNIVINGYVVERYSIYIAREYAPSSQ